MTDPTTATTGMTIVLGAAGPAYEAAITEARRP